MSLHVLKELASKLRALSMLSFEMFEDPTQLNEVVGVEHAERLREYNAARISLRDKLVEMEEVAATGLKSRLKSLIPKLKAAEKDFVVQVRETSRYLAENYEIADKIFNGLQSSKLDPPKPETKSTRIADFVRAIKNLSEMMRVKMSTTAEEERKRERDKGDLTLREGRAAASVKSLRREQEATQKAHRKESKRGEEMETHLRTSIATLKQQEKKLVANLKSKLSQRLSDTSAQEHAFREDKIKQIQALEVKLKEILTQNSEREQQTQRTRKRLEDDFSGWITKFDQIMLSLDDDLQEKKRTYVTQLREVKILEHRLNQLRLEREDREAHGRRKQEKNLAALLSRYERRRAAIVIQSFIRKALKRPAKFKADLQKRQKKREAAQKKLEKKMRKLGKTPKPDPNPDSPFNIPLYASISDMQPGSPIESRITVSIPQKWQTTIESNHGKVAEKAEREDE
ncbi:Dynein regulatory complex protein 10 like protein [Aduncisulcus paluster]|uniref:Dynein regulatory complex protein 10 n=1 Tax=Aduncisulcus paluster TaxID=2918883 RepID=A0ABQ5JV35_9EUKA|nr:Dynein regulatory complex protein 10 like protein [Aduncisulcus paluster]